MYDHESLDMEDLEGIELESLGMDGEGGWDGEGIVEESAGVDLESYVMGETSWDGEDGEGDQFVGSLIKKGVRAVGKAAKQGGAPLLKNLAQQAAQVAGGAIAGPTGANIARQIAGQVLREAESGDYEGDYEDFESFGGDQEVLDEMNYYAAMAAESESEAQADQFLGAIAGLAGPLIKSVAPQILGGLFGEGEEESDYEDFEAERDEFLPALLPMAAPLIGKGIKALGGLFRRNRKTRSATRALPRIAAKTAESVARQARRGRPVTPQTVARTMARQTAKTIASRPTIARAIQQNRAAAGRAQSRGPVSVARPRTNGYPGNVSSTNVYNVGSSYGGTMPTRRQRRLIGYTPVYAFTRKRG
jgi:hypothetical protein